MKSSTISDIKNHAMSSEHNEVCGFVLSKDGNEIIHPVDNMSDSPSESFVIHPREYVLAKNIGDILAVYHSHPKGKSLKPSEADVASCNRLGLPFTIYFVEDDRIEHILPNGEVPLIGRKFIWFVYDCYTLIQDYYKQKLNIVLPDFVYEPGFWYKGKNYYVENADNCGLFTKILDGKLKEHDLLFMQMNSRVPNHGAIYIGNDKILHHLANRLSCRETYGGYWRFVTTHVYRHKDLI